MLSQRRRSTSTMGRRSPCQSVDARYSAGWALTEIILIVVIPCFSWLVWSALSDDPASSWQSAASANRHGPLRTVRDIIALKDGMVLVVHRTGELRFWDQATNADAGFFSNSMDESRCGAFAPVKRLLAVASTRGTVRVWDVNSADQKPRVIAADPVSVCACEFTPDEKMLLTGGGSGELKLWDTSTWNLIATMPCNEESNAIHSLQLSTDGQFAFTGTYRGTVCKWNLADRSLECVIPVSMDRQPNSLVVGMFELTGSDEVLIATRGGAVSLWNHKHGREVRTLKSALDQLVSLVLTPDGQQLIGVSEHGKMQGWDISTGDPFAIRPFTKIAIPRALAVSGDGSLLIAGDNDGEIEFQPLNAAVSPMLVGKTP
jgi:WD40 repeat protein